MNELVGASRRALIGNLIQGSFACGIILYAASASEVRHWRSLTWLSAALGVPMVGVAMWLPESPRYESRHTFLLDRDHFGQKKYK